MRILLNGLCGFMGREVVKLAKDNYRGAKLIAGVDAFMGEDCPVPCVRTMAEAETDVDVIVDFSHHSCTAELLEFAVNNRLPLVLATTGHTDEEYTGIIEASKKIPLFFAPNYSLGIALLIELAKLTARAMPDADIEIVEVHHDRKIDAPSGTALSIAKAICEERPDASISTGRSGYGKRTKEEIGIQSVRIGNIVGIHEVMVGTQNQTITLKHEAHSRALFAEGALAAAEFICGREPGLYDMKSMISF